MADRTKNVLNSDHPNVHFFILEMQTIGLRFSVKNSLVSLPNLCL